jgi:FkbM family methyltransferase
MIYDQIINQGDLVFDIGANMGNRIDLFISKGAKVIGVEPQSSCYSFLLEKYKYNSNVKIVNAAISDEEKTDFIYISNANTISSMSLDFIRETSKERFKDYNWNYREEIKTTTLDILINEYGVPDFIKIDIEGYENVALRGLNVPVENISIEYVPEIHENSVECLKLISGISKNYKFNFSLNESLSYSLQEWISMEEMLLWLGENLSNSKDFGDIYAKIIKN